MQSNFSYHRFISIFMIFITSSTIHLFFILVLYIFLYQPINFFFSRFQNPKLSFYFFVFFYFYTCSLFFLIPTDKIIYFHDFKIPSYTSIFLFFYYYGLFIIFKSNQNKTYNGKHFEFFTIGITCLTQIVLII